MAKKITMSAIKEDAKNLAGQLKGKIGIPIKNAFPIEVFPTQIQEIILELNKYLKFPIDFSGVSILYATSLSVGNTHKVKVNNGWSESCVIYTCLVGRAGTNKSHPLSFAIKPIMEKDKESYQKFLLEKEIYLQASSISKKEREEKGLDEPTPPILQKFLISDYTPEAVSTIHLNNRRGIGVYIDELAGWFKNFNRYNKGSEQEQWLSNWSGKPIISDRKTGNSVYIDSPCISVIGTIQNDILEEISKDARDSNGFIDRILFAIPDQLQKEYWSEEEIPQETIENYNNIIGRLLDLQFDTATLESTLLPFSPTAKRILFDWQRFNTDKINNHPNDKVASMYSKLDVYIIRFSLILQMLSWACGEGGKTVIEENTMKSAILLTEYFRINAEKVHKVLSESTPFDRLPKDKQQIYEALPKGNFQTHIGIKIAENLGMKERSFKNWLNDSNLFIKVSYGNYERVF
ncbi:DUF3987 domain-containing protein [Emticicia sp.]|uniref:DUF3987 domain-containing protein n=1 Tax=Emticicia sp. TaxID=1930953 RepID=UPI0037511CF8